MTQEKILARLAAEPEEGMKLIMRLYTGLMCTVCRGILGSGASPQDVEDCVSAAFARFWFSRESYDPQRCGLSGWLCIIAKRQCIDMLRKNGAPQEELEGAEPDTAAGPGGRGREQGKAAGASQCDRRTGKYRPRDTASQIFYVPKFKGHCPNNAYDGFCSGYKSTQSGKKTKEYPGRR